MASLIRIYKGGIAEGKGFLVFSIILGIAIRLVYLLNFDNFNIQQSDGYLWQPIAWLFNDPIVSAAVSAAFAGGLAFFAANVNTVHLLIRQRTILPAAIIILLFSCHPSFIFMSAEYISAVIFLYIVSILFAAYNEGQQQTRMLQASFMLALASLFTPAIIVYLPVIWIAFIMMRCFNFKSILASLWGIIVVYFPVLSYYILFDTMENFLSPLLAVGKSISEGLPMLNFALAEWVLVGSFVLCLIVIIVDNYVNRHKDKIKTRALINLLTIVASVALLQILFLNIPLQLNIYIAFISGGLLLSHYYALAERITTIIFFFISFIFYILVCFIPFLDF